jgi:hypothetical protein
MIVSNLVARIAGAILLCPPDVIESTLPMIAPLPSSLEELRHRQAVDQILEKCWGTGDGFEVQLADEWIVNGGSLEGPELYRPSTYGEVTSLGARQLFDRMGMTTPTTETSDVFFMDLGSGAGKLVAQANLELKRPKRTVGVELAPSRHQAALEARNKLFTISYESLSLNRPLSSTLEFIEGDLLQADISQATHIYVSSLCFTTNMMRQLEEKLKTQASNLKCVASLQPFPGMGKANVIYIEMSWTKPNGSPVYFYTPNDF